MTSLLSHALDPLFPPRCILCGDPGAGGMDLCAGCREDLPVLDQACSGCGRTLAGAGEICGLCLNEPPAWTRMMTPLRYHAPVNWLVQRFKFDGRMNCGRLLASLMARRAPGDGRPELLKPVPLHRARLRERGFNQAEFLARRLGAELGIPVARGMLTRVRDTRAQSGLPTGSREGNVRRAFAIARSPGVQHVALVDDVLTTGHTAEECVRVLRRAGVSQVQVWVAARALRSDFLRSCA